MGYSSRHFSMLIFRCHFIDALRIFFGRLIRSEVDLAGWLLADSWKYLDTATKLARRGIVIQGSRMKGFAFSAPTFP